MRSSRSECGQRTEAAWGPYGETLQHLGVRKEEDHGKKTGSKFQGK